MNLKKNKKIRRPIRLDRHLVAPGDIWPVFDLDVLQAARKESLLVAWLFRKKPRGQQLKRD